MADVKGVLTGQRPSHSMRAMIMNFINGRDAAPTMGEASSELDMVQAIRAAHGAATKWAETSGEERTTRLLAFADQVEARANELATGEAAETGAEPEVARADVIRALEEFRARVSTPSSELVPVGVVGVIGARCFVLRSLLPRLGALLAAGNTVILKPSSRAPAVVRELAHVLRDSELPAGICNIVFGRGDQLGRFLVEHPGVPAITLFGTSATGRAVMSAGSAHLKRLSLHLGAKNAAIVLKDAPLEKLGERLARAAFGRAGLDPFALGKILVAQDIFEDVLRLFREASPRELRLPNSTDVERFGSSVALVRRENGRVEGGEITGDRVTPALVSDLTHCSEIHQDELLVPLVTLNPIKYPHEGPKWANTSPYGRAAAIFTAKPELAVKLARQLQVGTVWINGWLDDAASGELGGDQKASGHTVLGEFGASARTIVG